MVVNDFATEVVRCRALERQFGACTGAPSSGAGRYEWEYRTHHEARAWQSWIWLAQFATQARGLDAQAVYAALRKAATWPQWSEEACAWGTA